METNSESVTAECPTCGNKIMVKKNTASIFCVKCREWAQLKLDENKGETAGDSK